jgi:hypothetical protein
VGKTGASNKEIYGTRRAQEGSGKPRGRSKGSPWQLNTIPKGDHKAAQEHAVKAHEHSTEAHAHSTEAHQKPVAHQ